jgi:hypothetical protein
MVYFHKNVSFSQEFVGSRVDKCVPHFLIPAFHNPGSATDPGGFGRRFRKKRGRSDQVAANALDAYPRPLTREDFAFQFENWLPRAFAIDYEKLGHSIVVAVIDFGEFCAVAADVGTGVPADAGTAVQAVATFDLAAVHQHEGEGAPVVAVVGDDDAVHFHGRTGNTVNHATDCGEIVGHFVFPFQFFVSLNQV